MLDKHKGSYFNILLKRNFIVGIFFQIMKHVANMIFNNGILKLIIFWTLCPHPAKRKVSDDARKAAAWRLVVAQDFIRSEVVYCVPIGRRRTFNENKFYISDISYEYYRS